MPDGPDGRRKPVPVAMKGSNTQLPFETVIVTISEEPGYRRGHHLDSDNHGAGLAERTENLMRSMPPP